MPLTLFINGQQRTLDNSEDGDSLDKLIETLGFRSDRIAVEQNGQIRPRTLWASTSVSQGDRLEVVHFVGGGNER